MGHVPIPRKCVCDWDSNQDACPSCLNGADELDCMSIFSSNLKFYSGSDLSSLPPLDAFGRSKTQSEGLVYFTAHGKDYLYCASIKIFTQDRLEFIGQALCAHENFSGLESIKLIEPFSRNIVNRNYILPAYEREEFDNCHMIFLSCSVTTY